MGYDSSQVDVSTSRIIFTRAVLPIYFAQVDISASLSVWTLRNDK